MKTIRIGLYLGKRLQKKRFGGRKQKQMQQVQTLLRMARSLILLKPGSFSSCIVMLPQINAFLNGNGSQPALA